jgi:DNA-binding CsgD family transcriptional regulator
MMQRQERLKNRLLTPTEKAEIMRSQGHTEQEIAEELGEQTILVTA